MKVYDIISEAPREPHSRTLAPDAGIDTQLNRHYLPKYTASERAVMSRYVQDSSFINGMMFSKDAAQHMTDPSMAWAKDVVQQLDTIAQKHVTPADMTVYRGLPVQPNLEKGNSFTSKGFISTSVTPEFAKDWAAMQARGRARKIEKNPKAFSKFIQPTYSHIMQITVPKGTPGFFPNSGPQKEWVAPRDSKLTVNPRPQIDHAAKTVTWQANLVSAPRVPILPTQSTASKLVANTVEASKRLDTPTAIKTLQATGKVLITAGIVTEIYRGFEQIQSLPPDMPNAEYQKEVEKIVARLVAEFGLVYVAALAGSWIAGLAATALIPGLGTIAGAIVGFVAGGAAGYLALNFAGDSVRSIAEKIVAVRTKLVKA